MRIPKTVKMVEVGARDGLQNEAVGPPVAVKIAFINKLVEAGLTMIEAGAFVSPKAVPQMADSDQVLAGLEPRPGVTFSAITFNRKGIERAVAAGVGEIAIGTAASETFSQRNTNCTVAESLARVAEICDLARQHGLRVRGYVSTVLGCPYEGEVDPSLVAELAARMVELGCYEISLGDTIGVGTPAKAQIMIDRVAEKVPHERLALHFHDTYGQALANIVACLERGVAVVDSSVAGLGGCPYAPGAAGNVASEDVLYLLDGLGIESGVNLEKLAAAGRFITGQLGRPSASRVAQALESRQH